MSKLYITVKIFVLSKAVFTNVAPRGITLKSYKKHNFLVFFQTRFHFFSYNFSETACVATLAKMAYAKTNNFKLIQSLYIASLCLIVCLKFNKI